MLRYEGKNRHMLEKNFYELSLNMQRDSYVITTIINELRGGLCIKEHLVNDMLEEFKERITQELSVQFLLTTQTFGIDDEFGFGEKYLNGNVKRMCANEFRENPYVKNIKFNKDLNVSRSDIKFKMSDFEKFEIQFIGCANRSREYVTRAPLGYFDEVVEFPLLIQDGEAWMSITPSEINTMQHHINQMKGHVSVFGLGLGYFSYMCSLKADVDSVTIVELSQDIIDIFEEYILPQFENKEKIRIVKADACEKFIDEEFMSTFDSCFIDIWKSAEDGLNMYSFFKENERVNKVKPQYWLEEDMYLQMQGVLAAYILNKVGGVYERQNKDITPVHVNFMYDKVENYFETKKYLIKDRGDIYKLLFDKKVMNDIFKKPLKKL